MLPLIQSVIARRMLLNYRADPAVVQRLLPAPLQVDTQHGQAIVGVCLIRMEKVRPRGVPKALGFSCENMAHRVAIRYVSRGQTRQGVFIWRRDTDAKLIGLLGGRVFPGVHHHARFEIAEDDKHLTMNVTSAEGKADVRFSAQLSEDWRPTPAFGTLQEVSDFFRKGDCGFSRSLHSEELEGLQLKLLSWNMQPVVVGSQRSSFFSDTERFPEGSLEFDCGVLMRGIPHEWHQLTDIPELAASGR
jgi:uncharacterized protein YqjF (DUF2071 family)